MRSMTWTGSPGTPRVVALPDAEGTFFQPRTEAFSAASAEQWARVDAYDPGSLTRDGQWYLRFRAFAICFDDGRVIVVDAGIGPSDAPAAAWAPVPGHLPTSLAQAGIDPSAVQQVVLTHMHTDHIGWATAGLFPQAEILLQRAEWDWVGAELAERLPVEQLVLLDGDTRLGGGTRIIATPGHTPGHQSVLVGDDDLAITGDVMVHAIQLLAPQLPYAHEADPEQARQTRLDLLATANVLATSHLTKPFVSIEPHRATEDHPKQSRQRDRRTATQDQRDRAR